MSRRRRGSPPADLRAALAAKKREVWERFHVQLDPDRRPPPCLMAEALEAGEPLEFWGSELYNLVPGVVVNVRYRVNRDGSVDEVDSTPRKFPRAVRPDDKPAAPAGKENNDQDHR